MIKGRMVYIGGPAAMKRGWPKIMKEALSDAGGLWHRRYLPEHFRAGASTKYGFAPRLSTYVNRKARNKSKRPRYTVKPKGQRRAKMASTRRRNMSRKIDPNALVYRGDLKRELTRRATLSGTSKRIRVVMDVGGAWYGTAFFKKKNAPDMASEVTAILQSEEDRIAKVVEQYATRKLNAIKTQETRA
ncbi:MAG TPA: hypothetical protein VMX12_09140 [Acidimicrobiia bacterium]|nr:hypothetical protein [Acidimicrobiia bacterium]